MSAESKYGRRLSDDEYEARLVALHAGLPTALGAAREADVRRQEFELIIDHRLGTEFPRDRRQALWAVHERLERKRVWLVVRLALQKVFSPAAQSPAQRVARAAFDAYAEVLAGPELEAFLGVAERETAVLPEAGRRAGP